MMYAELAERLPFGIKPPTPEEYKTIEYVYTWHPAIKCVGGKEQIAALYAAGGMRVIEDMIPRANKAQCTEKMRLDLIKERDELRKKIKALTADLSLTESAIKTLENS